MDTKTVKKVSTSAAETHAVPHIGTIVVFRHPGPVYTTGKDFYVPAIVLGSNPDATVNLYVFTDHSQTPEYAVAYGPGVGQYQDQSDAVDAIAANAAAKAKEDAEIVAAKTLAAKRAEDERLAQEKALVKPVVVVPASTPPSAK